MDALVLCIDNSEFMLNGTPSRLSHLCDLSTHVVSTSLNHPEATVAVVQMADPRLLCASTARRDILLKYLSRDELAKGLRKKVDVVRAIKTANLTLKHRRDDRQHQKILMFVGSPVDAAQNDLEEVGAMLLRNGTHLNIVHMPDPSDTGNKHGQALQSLVAAAGERASLVSVPHGMNPLDYCISSGLFDNAADHTIEETDPELALALRLSLMEHEAAMARQQGREHADIEMDEPMGELTEEEQLNRAIQLSMQEGPTQPLMAEAQHTPEPDAAADLNEDEQMEVAIQMSMGTSHEDAVAAVLAKRLH
ncbi:von Willebrand factor type A domain [Carpediemonas membranifera]|uniref:von Willebrand factor type A domain n=1 Tax=Carpediemonas membranifera TaxID=201153 RepID=A0A8J6E1U2_9EUKA|nr:von Willebrand factor type A domain [Carpediemonas membranifera]|eukprot:KAG9391072.1 von Willebrand factor type A domain [Carpediemonas membranifera]